MDFNFCFAYFNGFIFVNQKNEILAVYNEPAFLLNNNIRELRRRRIMSMRIRRNLLIVFIIFVWIDRVFTTHFRGGTFYWAPVSKIATAPINISITQSYSWGRTYEFCDSSTITTQGLIGINTTHLQCVSSCGNSGGYCDCISTDVICTDYSVTQDISSGQKISFVSITQNAQFYLSYQDNNWLPLDTAASASWSITSYVNLVVRSDNGLLNTPPVVSVLPVIHIPVSVQSIINLLVVDIDNDYTQCRWARLSSVDECGGICQSVTGSQLLSNCSLIVTPTVTQVYYAAAIMVEDFYPSGSRTIPLSSTPVQFLIHVYNSPTSCSTLPIITGPYPDQSCIDVRVSVSFSFTVTAQIGCPGTSITDFISVSPIGMIKTSSVLAVSSTVFSIDYNWAPSFIQVGPHVFCVAAIGTYNIQSQQVCYKFIVGLIGSANTCPPTTSTLATQAIASTTTPTQIGQSNFMQYVFLGIGIGIGFVSAMIAMWAIHYFLNRQVCCLKSENNYRKTPVSRDLSTVTSSHQAFA